MELQLRAAHALGHKCWKKPLSSGYYNGWYWRCVSVLCRIDCQWANAGRKHRWELLPAVCKGQICSPMGADCLCRLPCNCPLTLACRSFPFPLHFVTLSPSGAAPVTVSTLQDKAASSSCGAWCRSGSSTGTE